MTRPDLDALAALLERATPGPWTPWDDTYIVIAKHRGPGAEDLRVCEVAHNSRRDEGRYNRDLIIATVNALPALIARVRELERQVQSFDDAIYDCAVAESRAALAMRERCAQRAESAQANGSDCAAAIRALEP